MKKTANLARPNSKLNEAARLMTELMETLEILSDADMMRAIRKGQADIKSGRVKELRKFLHEEAR